MQKLRKAAILRGQQAGLVGLALLTFVNSAMAELPTAATTAFTGVQTDGTAMQGLIWGPLAALTIGWKLMGMFKKGTNKI